MFVTEKQLELHVRDLIKAKIINIHSEFELLENKDVVDVIICKNSESPMLYFLEIKFYNPKNGRIGFGGETGRGFQPEILTKRPKYFETQMRWLFCTINDPHYYLLKNDELSKFIAGGRIGEKHNNFQARLFKENQGINETELVLHLANWLGVNNQISIQTNY